MTDARLPRLLTAEAVAEATGLSRARVYELARNGEMPAVRLGRAVRFAESALLSWISRGGTTSAEGDTK